MIFVTKHYRRIQAVIVINLSETVSSSQQKGDMVLYKQTIFQRLSLHDLNYTSSLQVQFFLLDYNRKFTEAKILFNCSQNITWAELNLWFNIKYKAFIEIFLFFTLKNTKILITDHFLLLSYSKNYSIPKLKSCQKYMSV